MRWRNQNLDQWHRWFAWYPVQTEGEWVWLDDVWRRLLSPDAGYEYEDTL